MLSILGTTIIGMKSYILDHESLNKLFDPLTTRLWPFYIYDSFRFNLTYCHSREGAEESCHLIEQLFYKEPLSQAEKSS